MIGITKNKKEILAKLEIEALNPMQLEAEAIIQSQNEVILLSPTGTGKTLAFLLPLMSLLDPSLHEVQLLIIVPSRELAIQIEQVARSMGSGYKVNAFYGGRNFSKDRQELKQAPAILVGTPGRISDHMRRSTFEVEHIKYIVLDEFDKSLEVGFEREMMDIVDHLPNIKKKVLTSATDGVEIPQFMTMRRAKRINYLNDSKSKLSVKLVQSPTKDKLNTLVETICHIGNEPIIIFCNYKDSINRVSNYLTESRIHHGCFYGGMEQKDRERALIKFRNGTHQIIVATDLAARGIDVPEIKAIIHYHLPIRLEEFIHRNGRTARMQSDGTAYILKGSEEYIPDFIESKEIITLREDNIPHASKWTTLFVSGGRKDKISKGDIAGLFMKKGGLNSDDVGNIELKIDCAFVAVKKANLKQFLSIVDNQRLKKKKVRILEI